MKKEDDSKWLLWGVYPMFRFFQITGNVAEFIAWLKQEHGKELDRQMLHGYKFFFETAFSQVVWSLDTNESLGIKHDFLLTSATKESFYIGKLPNSSPKTIFLKNLFHHFKPVTKASNSNKLIDALEHFQKDVISPFDNLFREWFKPKKTKRLSPHQIEQFLLIGKIYLLFNHINNNGPYAYHGALMKRYWIPKEKMDVCFEGYKYAVQFTWWKLLGERWYRRTVLKDIHTTKEWRGIIYNEPEPEPETEDEHYTSYLIGRTFDPMKQTSFDAFCYRIRDEFAWPFEKKYKLSITNMEDWYLIKKKRVPRTHFKHLLLKEHAVIEERTMEEELDMILYWYPVEIEDSVTYNAIPAFLTILRGAVTNLKSREKEHNKALVCKFTHPRNHPDGGNDYSYGILIDTKAAAGYYGSGWLIYYDCTGDYSGAAGAEFAHTEKIISGLVKQRKVELREWTVNHEDFRRCIAKYIRDSSERLGNEIKKTAQEIEDKLNENFEQKRLNALVVDSQSLLLELLSYYRASQEVTFAKFTDKKWNVELNAGEVDIILQNKTDVHIIECKLSPATLDLKKEVKKLRKKVAETGKQGSFEFWFWNEPNQIQKKILIEEGVAYFSFKEKGVGLPAPLKVIFNYTAS